MENRILVVQTAFLGDLLLAIPLLKQIRCHWPEHKIDLVCRQGFGSLMVATGAVDYCFEIIKGDKSSYRETVAKLKTFNFECIFVPHESLRTAFFVQRLKAKHKIGFKKWWNSIFFDHRISKDFSLPEALRQMQLMACFDKDLARLISAYGSELASSKENQFGSSSCSLSAIPEWASPMIELAPRSEVTDSARQLKPGFIAIFPGSVWPTKQWTEEGFERLAQLLVAKNQPLVLFGSQSERALCERIAEKAKASSGQIINLAGETNLVQTLQILKSARVVISNDSGGQHLAAVCGVPTVSIFGPTVLAQGFRPWNSRAMVVQEPLPCRPCGKHGHTKCPLGTHACMKQVTAEKVLAALDSLI